mgnify:CR=1 FL=1
MKAYERLLSYVKVFTPSSEETGTSPSTQYQFDLARLLVQELKELGVKDADVDEHCYVYGHIPATRGYESRQKLGFIAHMDTVSDFCDHPVTPVIIFCSTFAIPRKALSVWDSSMLFFCSWAIAESQCAMVIPVSPNR